MPGIDWKFSRGRGALRPAFTTNNAEVAVDHAVRGHGIAMVLSYQAAAQLAAGKLEVVLKSVEPPARPIQLVYAAGREPSTNVRTFIDFFAQALRPGSGPLQ